MQLSPSELERDIRYGDPANAPTSLEQTQQKHPHLLNGDWIRFIFMIFAILAQSDKVVRMNNDK